MTNIKISLPEQKQQHVRIQPGQTVEFAFDADGVTFGREDENLVLYFEDGSQQLLEGFFIAGEQGGLPALRLISGEVVDSAAFLSRMAPDLDITPAAGSTEGEQSGGAGAYESSPGELIAGIERLGGTEGFERQPLSAGFPENRTDYSVNAGQTGINAGNADNNKAPAVPGLPPLPAEPNPPLLSGGPETPELPGDAGGPDWSGGPGDTNLPDGAEEPGTAPHTYVRAALLGADGSDNPAVVLFLLNPDGSRMPAPFPASIEIEGNTNYDVSYNPANGTIVITLKNPDSGAVPSENITVTADGRSYIVQAGSSSGNNLAEVDWADAGEGVAFADKTWAGSAAGHLTGDEYFVSGHQTGASIVTPEGYRDTELHLQMTDSSLTATDESADKASASVELDLKNGSFSISNEGQAVFEVEHQDPLNPDYYWGYTSYDASAPDYEASVVTAVGAKGQNAENTVSVTGGDVFISAGGAALDAGRHETVNIGGVYAAEGGTGVIKADNINVGASSGGFARNDSEGKSATVAGIRSDGSVTGEIEHVAEWGSWTEQGVTKASETRLEAGGDVTVSTVVTGDAANQEHKNVSYGGVVATEGGQVNITAGDTVNISASSQAGGGALETSGIYGIFSGYGFNGRDLPTLEDFKLSGKDETWGDLNGDGYDEYSYSLYLYGLLEQYYAGKRGEWNSELGGYEDKGEQTKVSVQAGGDVNVAVDLGVQDYTGRASGVSAVMGDVEITSGGDINISASHQGVHSGGSSGGVLSAVELGDGRLYMRAEGDINLSVSGNGENVAAVNFLPGVTSHSGNYGIAPTHLSGQNVTFTGSVGAGGGLNNSIAGIRSFGSGFKKDNFTVQADEKFTIDVSALHNGGETSSTGIILSKTDDLYNYYQHYLGIRVDTPEFEIKASVSGGIDQGESRATGIQLNTGTTLGIASYDSLAELQQGHLRLEEHQTAKGVDSLKITAQGARHNTGIEVTSTGSAWTDYSRLEVRAKEMEVNARGGTAAGDSSSYGVKVVAKPEGHDFANATVNVQAEKFTVNVDNPQNSVGLSASGLGARISIGSLNSYDEHYNFYTTAIRVEINCTISNAGEQLRGIAIEALNGGHVSIISNDQGNPENAHDDSILINGDITVETRAGEDSNYPNSSSVYFETGYGDDRVEINGDINIGKMGIFSIGLGHGDDYLAINGGINLKNDGYLTINAGEGNDVISLNGKVDLDFYELDGTAYTQAYLQVDAGEGNDTLILTAPDVATFNDWYQNWLQQDGLLYSLQVENIVIQGVGNPGEVAWLTDMVNEHGGINLQFRGDESSINFVNDYSTLAEGVVALDGDNDTLYVRYDGNNPLENLSNALSSGLAGTEHLILDLADQGSLDELFSPGQLDSLFASCGGANIIFKVGSVEDMNLEGWSSTGQVGNVNGADYQVYTNAELNQQVFLQILNNV